MGPTTDGVPAGTSFEDADLEPVVAGHPTLPHALLVFAGGLVGTFLRYILLNAQGPSSSSVDWWLLIINVSGSLILGVSVATVFRSPTSRTPVRLFFASGLLGGWTTYSAIVSSTLLLGHQHYWASATWTVVLQLVLPVCAALIGLSAGERFRSSPR